jgi:site-specific recombinase XerD
VSNRPDPDDLTLGEAIDRWLRKRQTDATDETIRGYRSRMDQFLKWTAEHDLETIGDLDAWTLDEYQLDLRDQGYAPTTVKSRLNTVRLWVEYLEALDLVETGLSAAIEIPNPSRSEEQSETRLAQDDALAALRLFRESREHYGTGMHAFLEMVWHVGARMGAVQALDLEDFDAEEQSLAFRHRPSTETPLKNKDRGERYVGLSDPVVEALEFYVARERSDSRDRHGREPLFATRQGRASKTTLRAWSYQATQPCLWQECPHGKRRPTCEWTERTHASKCPSSRSPHAVRTGSITWQLNMGYPIELVAKRANATIPVIKQYYDQANPREEFYERRRDAETSLDISQMDNDT